jgi:hypothetical protein
MINPMPQSTGVKLLKAAWMSILLGIIIELLIIGAAFIFKNVPGFKPLVADLLQKITWSTLVCVGLAIGKAASQSNMALTGIAGFLAAPAAFHLARSIHKAATQALGLASTLPMGTLLIILSVMKAVEYAALGMLLIHLDRRQESTLGTYVGMGFVFGLVFGGATLALMAGMASKPLPMAEWVFRGINEVLFPVGCSLVLYAAGLAGRMFVKPATSAS